MSNRVIWCDRGALPYPYGFCPSERAWQHEMKEMGCDIKYPVLEDDCALCVHIDHPASTLVLCGDRPDRSPQDVIGSLVHEAVHVWQTTRDYIGEKNPSREFEAYQIHFIAMNLIGAYQKTRRTLIRAR